MLVLLGWKVAMVAKKRLPFEKIFVSLGVMVDFTRAASGMITVANKPGRLDSIREAILEVVDKDLMGFREALSIRGKITYAEGQLFSRVAAPACRILSKWASEGNLRKLSEEMVFALKVGCEALLSAGPRVVLPVSLLPPVVVFTDGACEESGTSIGGVIFDGVNRPEVFGAVLSRVVVESWYTKVGQKQVIGQAELLPLLVARVTWKNKLSGRRVLYFIDNDSARLGLIKAYSPVLPSLVIISECLCWDHLNNSSSWFARVPTESNIADDPSRMDSALLVEHYNARIVPPVAPEGCSFSSILE